MRLVHSVGLVSVVLLTCAAWNGCDQRMKTPTLQIYDVLPKEREESVTLRPELSVSLLSSDDIRSICSALGRTPGVKYEIRGIVVFPTNGFPMAVRVQVQGFFLFMCRGRDDHWHVFRTAQYRFENGVHAEQLQGGM